MRDRPDAAAPPIGGVPPDAEVEVLEDAAYGWARVSATLADGTTRDGWVDGRRLVDVAPADALSAPPPPAPIAAPEPAGRTSRKWLWVAAVAVLVLGAGGVVAFFALGDDDDPTISSPEGSDEEAGDEADDAGQPPSTEAGEQPDESDEGRDEPAGDEPTGDDGGGEDLGQDGSGGETDGDTAGDDTAGDGESGDEPVVDGITFSEEMLAAAIAAGEADPLDGLPARDAVTTDGLVGELAAAGYDLTGLRITVYPASSAPSFILMETDDSTALINAEDGGEAFVVTLLDSPVVAAAGTEQLVLRHSGNDDEGPFVITFMVPLESLRAAAAGSEDIAESVSVQVERP